MVTITYFLDSSPLDVDNVPKPILDALRGLNLLGRFPSDGFAVSQKRVER